MSTSSSTPTTVTTDRIPLDQIRHDTALVKLTGLDQSLIDSLRESIARHGLLHPIVLDRQLRVVDGHHRVQAILTLQKQNHEAYQAMFGAGVPVARLDLDLALEAPQIDLPAVELMVAANGVRRQLSKTQVLAIYDALVRQYGEPKRGRPAKDAPPSASEMLRRIFGRSRAWSAWIRRPSEAQADTAQPATTKATKARPKSDPSVQAADLNDSDYTITPNRTSAEPRANRGKTNVETVAQRPTVEPTDLVADSIEDQDADDHVEYIHQQTSDGSIVERSTAFIEAQQAVELIPAHERADFITWLQSWIQHGAA